MSVAEELPVERKNEIAYALLIENLKQRGVLNNFAIKGLLETAEHMENATRKELVVFMQTLLIDASTEDTDTISS